MSWNPNQGQDPNQPYSGYSQQPQPTDPYSNPNPNPQYDPGAYGQPGYGQPGQQYEQPGYQQYGQQQQQAYQQPFGTGTGNVSSQYGPSTMAMDPKTAAGLSYLGIWITGIIFFLLEKQNRFVRFHAMQSILFFGGLSVLSIIFNIAERFSPDLLSLAFFCLGGLVGLVMFIGWIVLMINAFQGKYFKLPVIGDYAERYANQGYRGV